MKPSEINLKNIFGRFAASRILTVFTLLFIFLPVATGQTADFTASSLTVCEGGAIVFTDASTGTTGSVSYAWDFGNGASPSTAVTQGPHSVTYSTPGTVTVTLTITDEAGTSTETKDNYITVNALPSVPVISASGPLTFCEGGSVTLTSSASSSYLWSTGATTQSIIVTQSGGYSLTVTDGNGCTSAESAVTNVTVNPTPATPVISASGPLTFCEGGSVTLTSGASASYLWSTGATTQSIIVTQSGDYSLTVTDGNGCTSAESAVTTVTVNPTPATPVISASGPLTFCEGGSVTLTSSASASYLWSTGATTQSIIVAQSGDYSLTVTDGNGCTSAESAVTTVTVNPLPVPTASSNTPVCEGDQLQLTGGPDGMSILYSWSGPDGFSSALQSPVIASASLASAGEYTLTVTNSNGCQAAASTTVEVTQQPVTEAGAGGDECDLTFVLGATPSVGTGTWTMTSGSGTATFSNPNSPTATVTVSSYGTKVFTWTEVNGTCSDADQVTVNFYQQPVAEAGTGGDECDLNFGLGATPSVGTGTWTMTSGTGTANFSNPNSPTATVTVSSYGTKVFTWTEVNGTCSDADQVTVNFYQQPVAEAGMGGNECDLTFVLGATPSVGTGTWTMTSGTGTANFSNPNSPTATVTVSSYGTKVFTWTEVNGTCSDADQVTVNFYQQPVAEAGTGGDECDLNFVLGATPSVGTGTWTMTSGTGTVNFSNPNSPTATVTVSSYGTKVFTWTEVNGTCSDADQVTVNLYQQPVAEAGTGGDECDLNFGLGATPSVGTGTWTMTSGSGTATFSNPNSPTATVTVSSYGTKVFTWTEVNGTCSDADQVTVNFYQQPVAEAGTGGNECDLTFVLGATPSVGTGTWTMTSGSGTATFSNPNSPTATVTVSSYGTKVFTWTEVNGTCSDADQVTVNFYQQPVAEAGTGGNECDLTFVLGATPSVGTGTWTMTSGSGTAIFSNPNSPAATVTVSSYGTKVFTWTEVNGTCSDADQVTVNFYQQPVAEAGTGGNECDLNFVLGATPSVGTGTWTMTSGTGTVNFSNPNSPTATVTVSSYGTKVFTWTEVNGTCSDADQVTVNFYQQPVAEAGTGGDECDLNFGLGATPSVGTGTWTMTSGTGTAIFSNSNSPTATVTVSSYGTKVFTWTEVNGTCSDADQVTVNFYQQPVAEAGMGGNECDLTFVLGATPSVGTGTWTMTSGSGTATFSNPISPTATVTVSSYGTKVFTWTEVNGTCSDADQVTVNFYPLPVADAGAAVPAICQTGTTAPLGGSVGGSATGGIWSDGGIGGTFNPSATNVNATWTPPAAYYGTATLTLTTTGGLCGTDTDSKQVTVNPNAVIDLTSGAASSVQTICIFSPLDEITYQVSGGGTGAGVTGLPAGITGTFSGGIFTISGTPTVSGIFNYTVTTTGTCAQATAQGTITVIALPVVTASDNSPVCFGTQLTLTGGPTGMSSYSWTGPDGFNSSQQNVTVSSSATLAMAGDYTLTAVNSYGCENNATTTVTVNPLPEADVSGTTTVCKDDPFPVITFTGSGGTPPYTFTYNINGEVNQFITTSEGNSATLFVPTGNAGIYEYALVSVMDGSETNCSQSQSGSATITVNSLPTAVIGGTTAVCQFEPYPTVTFTGSGGTAPYTFVYTINSIGPQVVTSTGSTASVAVPTEDYGSFTYSLVSVSDASSTSCSQAAGGSATITVNALPEATISGSREVCQGSASPAITFTGSSGRAPYTFTYRVNNGGNQTITTTIGSSVSLAVPTAEAGDYIYELISVRDGSSTTCEQPQSGSATIVVNPLPAASVSGTTDVCRFGDAPLITFTGSNGTSPYTFTYSINSRDPLTVSTAPGSNTVSVAAPTGIVGSFTYALSSVRDGSSTSCTSPASGTVTINVLPLPTATIGGTTAVCQNAPSPNVTFTGFNGTPPYTFVYTVNGGDSQTVIANSGNSVTVPVSTGTAGVFEYTLVSVSDGSSQSCSQSQEGNAVITVNPLPVATITGAAEVCQYDPEPVITFTGSGGTSPYTFTYRVNGNSNQTVISTGSTAVVPVSTDLTGAFTFTLVSVRDASSTACSQSASGSATITVNTIPTATISGSTDVCQNSASPEVLFTGASGISPYTFTYRINNGTAETVTTAAGNNTATVPVSTALAGTFTYELLSVSDGSASVCDQSQSGTAVVRVNPLPEASISGSTSVCRNDASPLVTFTGSAGTAPYTFTYTINNGEERSVMSTGNVATVSVPTATAGIFTYSLVNVQDASSTSCSQTATGEVIVTINELPATSAISGDATPPCEATGVTYSVVLTPGSTYTWTVPEGATIVSGATGPDNNSITVNFSNNNGNISVIETNPNGCSGAMVNLPVSLQGCALNPNFTVNNTAVCSGSSVVFTSLSSGTSGSTTYSWDFGTGANPSTATGAGPHAVIYTGSGTSTVSLTITDGATETETRADYITINPLPTATIAGTTTVCEDSAPPQVTFTGASGTEPYRFTYTVNGGEERTVQTSSGNSVAISIPTGTPDSFLYELVSVRDGSSTACEQSATGSVTVTVNPLPQATIAGTATVCRLDDTPLITFTGSNGTRPYTFSYRMNGGGIQTITTTATSNAVTIPVSTLTIGSYSYELISVRDGGSTACEQSATGTAVVTVNPLPTATISGTTTVCRNAEFPNITFAGANGTPPYTFTYTVNSGTPRTVTTVVGSSVTVPVSTNAAGTFTYSLVSVQDRGTEGCSQNVGGNVTVTVNQLPTATLIGTTAVCEGDPPPSVTFTGANGTEPYTFTYRLNGSNFQTITSSSGNNVSITVPTGEPGTFAYELVSVSDASSTTCSQSQEGTAVVTVNPMPTATINGTSTVCRYTAGAGITLTGYNGTPPYTFNYNINSGVTRTVTTLAGNSSVTIPAPTDATGVFTYSLMTVRDASSTACQQSASGSATITVLPLPTASIGGTTTVCRDDEYPQVTFTGATGSPPYTFIYNINGQGELSVTTNGGNTVSVDVPTETPGVYRYNLIAVIDGSSNSCSNNQEGSAVVTIRELPEATITGGGTLCVSDAQPQVTFEGSAGQRPYTFTYTLNSGDPLTVTTISGNSVSLQVPTNNPGTFEYELLSVTDAGTPTCGQAQTGTIIYTVNPLPEATISGSTVVCRDDPEPEITFRGSNGTAPYTFTYTINGGTLLTVTTDPGQSNITITGPTAVTGTYVYELVSVQDASATGCSQTQEGSIVITVQEIPVAYAGTGGEICGPEYQLRAIPDIGSGVWSMSSGTGTANFTPDANDPEAIVTVSEYGLKEFTWTEFNGVCSDDATIEVVFWEMPQAIAGPGGESCNLTFTLNATPDIGTGTWSMSAGTGTATFIPNANAPDAVVEVTEYGAKEFTWTEVNGTCTNADDLEVVFYQQPVANAGTGGNNCGRIFNLRAIPSYGTGTWSVTSGPGSALFLPNVNSPTATAEIDVFGTYEFTWTEVNGSCSDNATIEVSFFEILPANGGDGGTECDLDFVFNATPGTGNGVWSMISGPGNAIFEPGPEYPDASVIVDQFGTYEFGWTEVNVVCQSTDIVVVDFHDIPSVATINDTILCRGSTVELITSGEGSFVWSPAAFLDQTDIRNPIATPDTTVQYVVTLTDQFGCVNADTVVIGIVEQPVADAGPDRVLDYIFDAQLQAELRPGETGSWSLLEGGGTFDDNTAQVTMITGLSLGENLIEWMVTNGICPVATDLLSITVNDLVIPTLITPNGDPLNEYFELRGIETLGVTELIIFDRGGTQVYRSTNYANDWNGVDQHGNQLPEDTYFYVMRPQNGTPRSGYIVIRR